MEEKNISEQESLKLIQEMIGKAKSHFHTSGASSIIWGCVIGTCGLVSYAELEWSFSIGFDIWLLTILAIAPSVWINIRESRRKTVKTYEEAATDVVWTVYAISIIALVVYVNVIPGATQKFYSDEHIELFSRNLLTGEVKPFRMYPPSAGSIFIILYAFPTMVTGLLYRFKPMIIGAVISYCLFVVSLFVAFKYDMLLGGVVGIVSWLIPGLILNARYRKAKASHV